MTDLQYLLPPGVREAEYIFMCADGGSRAPKRTVPSQKGMHSNHAPG